MSYLRSRTFCLGTGLLPLLLLAPAQAQSNTQSAGSTVPSQAIQAQDGHAGAEILNRINALRLPGVTVNF